MDGAQMPAPAPKTAVLVYSRTSAPREQRIDLVEGVTLIGLPLDTRAARRLYAAADDEIDALRAGGEASRAWGLSDAERAELVGEGPAVERAAARLRYWMRAVLLAEAFTIRVEGLETPEGDAVDKMDFDLALWLMCDARFETALMLNLGDTQKLRVAEKNG